MERTGTPLMDEQAMVGCSYSPVSDPWRDVTLQESSMDQLLRRLNTLETLVRDQYLTTREHVSKCQRDNISIERGMLNKVCQNLQAVAMGIEDIKKRHQADPTLMSGIMSMVNSALLYLQTTAPDSAPAVASVDNSQNGN